MDGQTLFSILLPIFAIQFVGWATPGPNHLTIITASVTAGRGAGIRAGLGIAAGAVAWSLIVVSGIAVIFQIVPEVYIGLRIIGAVYLVYLGVNAFRAAGRGGVFRVEPEASSPATTAPFRTAFLVMMTNPKAVLFFGAIITALIPADAPRWLLLLIVAQIGLTGAFLNVFAGLFFSAAPIMRWFQRTSIVMSVVFGLLFCGLGVAVVMDMLR